VAGENTAGEKKLYRRNINERRVASKISSGKERSSSVAGTADGRCRCNENESHRQRKWKSGRLSIEENGELVEWAGIKYQTKGMWQRTGEE